VLNTNLEHLERLEDITEVLENNENVMVCCGRMGPMCVPVFAAMEKLINHHQNVQFRDMDFDVPASSYIRNLPECSGFMGLPFTVYFKEGKVAKATSSIQSIEQIKEILDEVFYSREEVN